MKKRKVIARYDGYSEVFGLTPGKYYVIHLSDGFFGGIKVERDEIDRVDKYKDMRHFHLFWSDMSYI